MSKQSIRRAWPLYLAIAVSGAASIATSVPPPWSASHYFQGPALRLDPTQPADAATFTIMVSPEYADPTIEVTGVLTYELDEAPQDLRIALEAPGQSVLAEQIHHLEGAGQLEFSLSKYAQIQCALASTPVCQQTLALTFETSDASGGTPAGAPAGIIDIEWYLSTRLNGDTEEAPPDLVFEVDIPDGTPIAEIPWLEVTSPPEDQGGDGRWFQYAPAAVAFDTIEPLDGRKHVIMRGEGGFTSSRLHIIVTLSSLFILDDGDGAVDIALTVIPDEPGTAPAVQKVITFTGDNETAFEFSIPEPLDCPPGPACERSFTITFDVEGEDAGTVAASLSLWGVIEGEGEALPADAQVYLYPDPVETE